jgi:hypothetical protein
MAYLREHYEPDGEVNDIRMKQRTRNYKIINNQLYKQGICARLLKYISAEEGKKYYQKYTKEFAAHTLEQEQWQEKHFVRDFIGHQPKMTAKKLSNLVIIAKCLQAKQRHRQQIYKQ